jgi:predicted transcriptional regulator YdeE
MKYKTVHRDAMLVVGVSVRTTNENWQVAEDLPPFWGTFWRENIPDQIQNKTNGDVLGLYCEYEKDHTKAYSFVAGCEVNMVYDLPERMILKRVPAAKYAVFRIQGLFPAALMEVWNWIWEGHLDRTYTGDFEVYPVEFSSPENTDMLLYVAIK